MTVRYALEFRSGNYFSVDHAGSLDQALTFNSEHHARVWFDRFAPWVWCNGGMIVPMPTNAKDADHE